MNKRHPQQTNASGLADADRRAQRSPGLYHERPSGRITRPEMRRVLEQHNLLPRTSETATQRHAQAPGALDEEAVYRAVEMMLEQAGRNVARDSIADAEQRATDASSLAVETTESIRAWVKRMVPIAAVLMTLTASCGTGLAAYVAANRGNADATKTVAIEAAQKAVEDAPKQQPEKVFVYVPVPTPPTAVPVSSSTEGGTDQ